MSTPPDVWTTGTDAKNPEAGLPNVTDLAKKVWEEVQKDFAGFLMAGLVPFIGSVMAGFGMVIVIYGGMFIGMVPGMLIGDEAITALGSMAGLFGSIFFAMMLLMAVIAPLTASLHRAVWNYLEKGEKLTISSSFSTVTQDLGRVIAFQLLVICATMIGAMMCYLPALIVGAALMFAGPAIYIHRLGIGEAVSLSIRHTQRNPGWHIGFFGISFLITIVLSYIPILGGLMLMTVHPMFVLLAYREVFGAGERPRDSYASPDSVGVLPGELV